MTITDLLDKMDAVQELVEAYNFGILTLHVQGDFITFSVEGVHDELMQWECFESGIEEALQIVVDFYLPLLKKETNLAGVGFTNETFEQTIERLSLNGFKVAVA